MGNKILVNKENLLSKSYIPDSLVQEPSTEIWIKKDVCKAFGEMNKAIQKAEVSKLILVSGYRSYDYQEKVFNRKTSNLIKDGLSKDEARKEASTVVAVPGTSEHQTGLAIDVTNASMAKEKDPLIEEFEQTKHGKWLRLNAHLYGFILRYPKDKMDITHITYEPWHYRYVGVKTARIIKKFNICLEEYIISANRVDKGV